MLYTLSIPVSKRLLIEYLINQQRDYCYNYRPWLRVNINSSDYVSIGFAHGRIDNHAVFVHLHTKRALLKMPLMHDKQLLGHFIHVSQQLQAFEIVWLTVLKVYLYTQRSNTPRHDWTFKHLKQLNEPFPTNDIMWLYLAILNLAMISEEFYTRHTKYGVKGTVLGKRMKFVGLYQTLREYWHASDAAMFSRHKPSDYIERCFQQYWLTDQQDPNVKGVTNEYFRQLFM